MKKIKRYGSIYKKRRRFSPWKIALFVVLIAACFFVGFSIYDPVIDFLQGGGSSSSEPSSQPGPAPSSSNSSSGSPSSDSSEPIKSQGTVALYMPAETLTDSSKLDAFIKMAKEKNANAVLVELKDETGALYYQSAVEAAKTAVSPNAVSLPEAVKKLSEGGLTPMGYLHAFKDATASRANVGMAVQYRTANGGLWLDNYANRGGKPWLNPNAEAAREYISALCSEVAGTGIKQIVLDSVQFPTGVGLNLANYGANSASLNKTEVLSGFLTNLEQKLQTVSAKVVLAVNYTDVLTGVTDPYGGSPLSIQAPGYAPYILPSTMPAKITVDGVEVSKPAENPGTVVQLIAAQLRSALSSKGVPVLPFIQAYSDTAKTYTQAEIDEQIKAVTNHLGENMILYSPDGAY